MIRFGRGFALAWLVLAILLQADAVVKSTVMQIAGPDAGSAAETNASPPSAPMQMAGMEDMPGMAGMQMSPPDTTRAQQPDSRPARRQSCPYCDAAGHIPLLATAAMVRSSRAVSFTTYRLAGLHGPRGPPPFEPRARGPPSIPA